MTVGVSPRTSSGPAQGSTNEFNGRRSPATAQPLESSRHTKADTLYIPCALFGAFFLVYALTATGSHTFDGIAYIRDMGKPLAAMVLPHHLIYEPAVFGFYSLWRLLGWGGHADLPAQILSSLAGAGGVAVFYKIGWEIAGSRAAALLATLALALSYGYWFYSVEVEIYVPPLFFLLVTTWLLGRGAREPRGTLFWLMGLSHATAALIHQASLFIVPAFALGILLIGGQVGERVGRVVRYGVGMAAVVLPAYLVAGALIAGQNTPESFMRWANNYGSLGTWGVWHKESLEFTVSGLSAAVSSGYWVGRALVLALFVAVLVRAAAITKRGGPLAWTLWVWLGVYGLFFAWWQPENLKFWVLVLPAPLLLLLMGFAGKGFSPRLRSIALGLGAATMVALAITNAPTIWAKRDPMDDPARRVSEAVGRMSGAEDLIVLQAGSAEHYLPFYYDRINIISTRELWYLAGGALGRQDAMERIRQRTWHSLAKGSNVWIEGRVLTTGEQRSDHYVFSPEEIEALLSPYGERVKAEEVGAGPELFYKLTPQIAFSRKTEWKFERSQEGWSGVNISNERVGVQGWCFSPRKDPNLYGPPLQLPAEWAPQVEIEIGAATPATAQLFYRTGTEPYSEERSVRFEIIPDEEFYILKTEDLPGWSGTITGLRLDPAEEAGVTGGVDDTICLRSLRAGKPKSVHVDNRSNTR